MRANDKPSNRANAMTRAATNDGDDSYRIIVTLPAFNEEENIGPLLDSISTTLREDGLKFEILVVEDGSTDRTLEILREYETKLPLTVYPHPKNQGLGPTIRDGLRLAAERGGSRDIVVTLDADQSHNPGLIRRMVGMVREGRDIVIASRYQPGAQVVGLSKIRELLSIGVRWMMRALFPIPHVRDYTCGFRAYRVTALTRCFAEYGDRFVDQAGFQCMADILLKARLLGLIMGEVPMILRYDLKLGASKMRVARTVKNTLLLMLKRRFVGVR
jgi:dolichol-phosphate mannosyltransferase